MRPLVPEDMRGEPLADKRPTIGGCPRFGGSNTPTELLKSSLPTWTIAPSFFPRGTRSERIVWSTP